jgi:hypothetical protein
VSTYNSPPPLLARTARDKPQPRAGHHHPVTHLEAGQLTPPKALHREYVDQLRIRASARLGQSHHFIEVEEPALAPRLPPGRSFRRRGSIHRHSAVRHRK